MDWVPPWRWTGPGSALLLVPLRPQYSGSDAKGTDAGTATARRREYRSSTAISCVKLATGPGAVPAFIGASHRAGEVACPPLYKMWPPFHHVAPRRRPFSLAWEVITARRGGEKGRAQCRGTRQRQHDP